ncbi:hypothetical protein PILCRDRAFT_457329 [Piloderma croceum F 1598]|uniref:Uncharacterized protein n=1 Tax=Piloderma croceum (strain F 1598) TaxID=765440 RepID=A0A0C3FSZ1_PILCF|nr:hypothetical protein PILCRDRAFT_457329 [Piloderma croceum F 1598]
MRGKLRHPPKTEIDRLGNYVTALETDVPDVHLQNAVRYFLRPSEDVKVTLETSIVGKRTEEDDGKNQRVLAVVTHQNEAGEEREGSWSWASG